MQSSQFSASQSLEKNFIDEASLDVTNQSALLKDTSPMDKHQISESNIKIANDSKALINTQMFHSYSV